MSGELVERAWQAQGLKPSEKLTLLFAADIARDEHGRQMWCKASAIVAATGLSRQSIKDALRSLVEAGHMSRVIRPGTTTIFTVHPIGTGGNFHPRYERDRESILPPGGGNSYPGGGGNLDPGVGVKSTPLTIIEPSIEPSGEPPRRADAAAPLPEWIPVDAWNGFVDMRRRAKAPLTKRAIELSIIELRKLRATGNEPGAVLDQSTSRGWKGLFPIKDNRHGSHPSAHDRQGPDSVGSGNPLIGAIARRREARSG